MKKRLLAGALAGALGGVAMKAVVQFVHPHSFGLSAETDANTAHEMWRRLNWEPLTQKHAERIGAAMHYGFSVAAGAMYAAALEEFPLVRLGSGGLFGTVLWLLGDELAVSAAGLEDPFRTPAFSHASALAAHIVYGVVVDTTQSALLAKPI